MPRPAVIDGGQDAAGLLEYVQWSRWGGAEANGTGRALYVPPGKSFAEGTREKATVVAFDLGQCHGRPAYRKLTWYFPQHGGKLKPADALGICDA